MSNYLDAVLNAGVDILLVAKEIAPGGKIVGGKEYRAKCPFHDDKNPSFYINILNGKTHCFGCGHRGDIIRDYAGVKFNALNGEILRMATDEIIEKFSTKVNITNNQNDKSEFEAKVKAFHIWEKSVPRDKMLDLYLNGRKLTDKNYENLRFYKGNENELFNNGKNIPVNAMIAKITNINNELQSLHITVLEKQDGSVVRRGRFFLKGLSPKGGLVVFGNLNNTDTVALAEGIETTLSVKKALPHLVVCSALSTSLMPHVLLPSNIKTVLIFADNDKPGLQSAQELKSRLESEGKKVSIFTPPKEGEDFNDLLKNEGVEGILRVFMSNQIESKSDLRYIIQKNFLPRDITNLIIKNYKLFVDRNSVMWFYDNETGLWIPNAEAIIRSIIRTRILAENSKSYYINETIKDIREYLYKNKLLPTAPLNLIPLNNGVFDLDTDEFVPYSPDFYLTNKIPINYNPNATCKKIDEFFKSIMDDHDELWQLMAYTLYRSYPYQKFFILYGPGGNGKTTFTALLEEILGKHNTSHVNLKSLIDNRFAVADLHNKLANITDDEKLMRITSDGTLKSLTGGNILRAERKNEQPFEFKNYAKLIIQTNVIPKAPTEATIGFYRRIHLIKFEKRFDGKNDRKDFIYYLVSDPHELEGAVIKMLQTLKHLRSNNFEFKHSERAEKLRVLYQELSNPLQTFVEKFTYQTHRRNEWIKRSDFLKLYNMWLKHHNLSELTKHEMKKQMLELGFKPVDTSINGSGAKVWRNLAVSLTALKTILSDVDQTMNGQIVISDDVLNNETGLENETSDEIPF